MTARFRSRAEARRDAKKDAPLSVEDFFQPLFNEQPFKRRMLAATWVGDDYTLEGGMLASETPEYVIEGVTRTDNFVRVGCTYFCSTGIVEMVNTKNEKLFKGKISSRDDFEKALKKAEKQQRSLDSKKSSK